MKNVSIRLPEQLKKRLEAEAKRSGVRPAEFIRAAVDRALTERESIAQIFSHVTDMSRDQNVTS